MLPTYVFIDYNIQLQLGTATLPSAVPKMDSAFVNEGPGSGNRDQAASVLQLVTLIAHILMVYSY
jgi:hypothetical protein